MKARSLLMLLLTIHIGCASAAKNGAPGGDSRTVDRGLNTEPYAGAFSGYRPLEESLAGLDEATEKALRRIDRRLGIAPDPERPRILRVADDAGEWSAESAIIGGRTVQVIVLPAAPLAQGRAVLSETLIEALTHSILTDARHAGLPRWFRLGAPRWISGRMERSLVGRVLAQEKTPVSEDRVLPGFDPLKDEGDPLSGAFFIAWLAETFGPEVLPEVVRTLRSADSIEEGLRAALPHDPASLEVGFDTYRVVRVAQLADDPYVQELLAVRTLPAAEQVVRLSGLSSRATHPVVGAAAAEALGRAQYEAGDYTGAADTLARVEREYLRDALDPDRDRFLFAMTFAQREEDSAAALRFESFLLEFPTSPYAPRALFELSSVMLDLGRSPDAMARFKELSERFPDSPYATKSLVVLGAWQAARHRYALARSSFERALPDAKARAALDELTATTAAGLPEEGRPAVRQALRDLASLDAQAGRIGVLSLQEIGPLATPDLCGAAANSPGHTFDLRMIEAVSGWGLEAATPVLVVYLARQEKRSVTGAFDALAELGATPGRVREILDGLPAGSTVAESVWLERYGGTAGIPEVAELISDSDFERRIEACRILATLDRPEAVRALRRLLDDSSPAVRRASANAFGNLSGPDSRDALSHALADVSVPVRLEAIESLARLKEMGPLRNPGLTDEAGTVRLSAAARLLAAGADSDYALIVSLLSDPEGGVATGIESLLRDSSGPAYEGALVDGLLSAEDAGVAMRFVRLMCRRVDHDLGYDPGAGDSERERVAARFVALLEESGGDR